MRFLLLFLSLSLCALSGHASMIIDRAIVIFEAGGTSRQDVIINNPDAEPLYIKVSVLEVLNPGTEQEERKEITDPRSKKLIATPNKIIVPPGGRKQVRLVNLAGHQASESVYRVNLTPVTANPEANDEETNLKILIGYQLLVFVEPIKNHGKITALRNGKSLLLENTGNTNVMLRNGTQCPSPSADETECVEVNGKRLYPGAHWQVDLPFDQPVEFSQTMGNKNSKVVFE